MKSVVIVAAAALMFSSTASAAAAVHMGSGAHIAEQQRGAFAGARLRLPFGGKDDGKLRAGLALAPTQRLEKSTQFGEGIELHLARNGKPALSLGGKPVNSLKEQAGKQDKKLGVSTIGWVAIGVGAAIAVAALHFSSCGGLFSDDICED